MKEREIIETLESLLTQVRADRQTTPGTIEPGDIVQIKPGADPNWKTSLMVVKQVREDGTVRGEVLRPHRSGAREAWYTYTTPELQRIGPSPFPEPERKIKDQSYPALCPRCQEELKAEKKAKK